MNQKKFEADNKRSVFFAAYAGPSMNPTLREPEMMEIAPYCGRPLRVGDVVFFLPPEIDQPVVHRVARITPYGISTRGDNNAREDSFFLQMEDINGRVAAAWRGRRRREIAGGFKGRLTSAWLRRRRIPCRVISPLLYYPYFALSRLGLVARLLPSQFRPRVVVFEDQGRDRFRLLLGRQVIGLYDDRKLQWQIRRPFRLFVDERTLQCRRKKEKAVWNEPNIST